VARRSSGPASCVIVHNYRLSEAREAILAMPQMPEKEWREVRIRKANGDTQRMRSVFGAN
jgi:hypothetical protein